MKKRSVPFFKANIKDADIKAVQKVLKSGWLTTGKVSHQLEDKITAYTGAKYAVAVNSCTAGMILCLKALNIGRGDQVITTPYTFVATVEAILSVGAKPVFADIDPLTLNIDPVQIEAKITSHTKAILPVHIAGLPCRMDKIAKIARKYKLKIVHDAAHALGASFKSKQIGKIGDISAFSFYATKNLTTAEGGMVTTDNKKLADKVQVLSLHGMDKKAWKRYLDSGNWYYEVVEFGYKFNLPDLNAALGLSMMDRFENLQKKRAQIAGWYDSYLADCPEIELPATDKDSVHAWHLYIIKLNLAKLSIDRNQFIKELTALNIGTSVHFIPLFMQPYYKHKFGLYMKHYPQAQTAFSRVISVPFYPDLCKADVKFATDCIKQIIAGNRI